MSDDAMTLVSLVRQLPPRQRDAVVLRYYEDLPEVEIARILGCAVGTVKSQLSKARGTLARALDGRLDGVRRVKASDAPTLPEKVAPVPEGDDLEARLRNALSQAAPLGLPTIGVRERIVDAVRGRRARRQRVAGALAAGCLVVAGLSVGVATLHPGANSGKSSADALHAAAALPHSPVNPGVSDAGGRNLPAARTNCGEIAVSDSVVAGCHGVFGKTSPSADGPLGSTVPKASVTSEPGPGKGSTGATYGGAEQVEVVVPVGRPVTLMLPGSPGEIWTAPAVVPGQGTDASRVTAVSSHVAGVGKGSSATFESSVAVTVEIDASALAVCGEQQTPCGAPTSFWSVFLEFRAS